MPVLATSILYCLWEFKIIRSIEVTNIGAIWNSRFEKSRFFQVEMFLCWSILSFLKLFCFVLFWGHCLYGGLLLKMWTGLLQFIWEIGNYKSCFYLFKHFYFWWAYDYEIHLPYPKTSVLTSAGYFTSVVVQCCGKFISTPGKITIFLRDTYLHARHCVKCHYLI